MYTWLYLLMTPALITSFWFFFFWKWAHWWRHRHRLDRFRFQNFQSPDSTVTIFLSKTFILLNLNEVFKSIVRMQNSVFYFILLLLSNYPHLNSANYAITKCCFWDVPSVCAPIRNGLIQYTVQRHLQGNWQLHSWLCKVLMLPHQDFLEMQMTECYGMSAGAYLPMIEIYLNK